MRLTPPVVAAAVALTLASCGSAQRPTIGRPRPPTPSTTWPSGNDTATTQPAHPSGDPWADAIDIAPDADPCPLLTDVVVTAVLGDGDHEGPDRDGAKCRVTDGAHELSVELVDHDGVSRDVVSSRFQSSKPKNSLDAVDGAAASIIFSRAEGEGVTAVFLVSSMVHFEYSHLDDPQAFFDALAEAMRRPGTG
jgi:hypothetical protein